MATLEEFLALVGGLEASIMQFSGAEALAKVQGNGRMLELCVDPDDEIRLAAIAEDPWAIQFIDKQDLTEEMILLAVNKEGNTLQHVDSSLHTEDICIAAVSQNGNALTHVKTQSDHISILSNWLNHSCSDSFIHCECP